MRIMILEDEKVAARRLKRLISESLDSNISSLELFYSFEEGMEYLNSNSIDLLFLDLNLNGCDGFDLLYQFVERAFETVVVSANTDRAIEAFELGVIDFIPKPFDKKRLQTALNRFTGKMNRLQGTTTLVVKNQGNRVFVKVSDIEFIQGAGDYSEIHCVGGEIHLHTKSMDKLSAILPESFIRIHKSYIVDKSIIKEVKVYGGGKYGAILNSTNELPISRSRYKENFLEDTL